MWLRLVLAIGLSAACTEACAAPVDHLSRNGKRQLLTLAFGRVIQPPSASRVREFRLVASLGPSFDCATVTAPLPLLVCKNPRLALIDLMMVQAYQGLRAQVDETTKTEIRAQALDLHQRVHAECNIPQTGPLTRDVENAADCVESHYMGQRKEWLSRLNSDAREEATRPIRRHLELQRVLQQLNFLSSIANVDGVYGPETRNAISSWQRSRGLNDTGILSDAHAAVLERAPAEKAAEEQRQQAAAQELERQRLQREQWDRDQQREQRAREETRQQAAAQELERQRLQREQWDREQQREQRAREETRQRESDAFQAKWDGCRAYQLPACDAALQSSNLASWQRADLIAWRSTSQQFAADVQACRNGTIAACDIASKSPAATGRDQAYLSNWRDAASFWTRAWTYIRETSATVKTVVVGAPLSTLIASGIAVLLAIALIALLLVMRRRTMPLPAVPPQPEPEPAPAPPPTPPSPRDYSVRPSGFSKQAEQPSRPAGSSSASRSGGLHAPHMASQAAGRQPKFVSGGTKAAGVAINVLFPGIGSFIVRKPIAGACQILFNVCNAAMAFTGVLAPVALIFQLGNWLWAVVGAANAPTRPLQVVVQNGPAPGQF